jgi:hypothetical protein
MERGSCPLSVAQATLLVEPCSVGRKARQREPCTLLWCSAGAVPLACRDMLGRLDGLTDKEREPCSLSLAHSHAHARAPVHMPCTSSCTFSWHSTRECQKTEMSTTRGCP